jgi:hypothetical protein
MTVLKKVILIIQPTNLIKNPKHLDNFGRFGRKGKLDVGRERNRTCLPNFEPT